MKKNVRLSSLLVFSAVFLVSCGSTPAKSSSSQSNTASTQSTSYNSDSSSSEEKVAFTKKAVNLYTMPTSHVNVSLYFTDKNPDIPFIDFAEFNKEVEMTYASSLNEVSGVLTIHNGNYVSSIDFKKGLYYVEDFEHFFAQGSKVSFLDTMAMTAPDASGKYHYLKRDDSSVFLTSGGPISIDLSTYDIPLYTEDGKAYLPLATYSDLFVSPL
jgi:hypothetical protein